jgi:hypothetical protein
VGGVHGVEIQVNRHATRAADAGHYGNFIFFQAYAIHGPDQGSHDDPDPAAAAPHVGKFLGVPEVSVSAVFFF